MQNSACTQSLRFTPSLLNGGPTSNLMAFFFLIIHFYQAFPKQSKVFIETNSEKKKRKRNQLSFHTCSKVYIIFNCNCNNKSNWNNQIWKQTTDTWQGFYGWEPKGTEAHTHPRATHWPGVSCWGMPARIFCSQQVGWIGRRWLGERSCNPWGDLRDGPLTAGLE